MICLVYAVLYSKVVQITSYLHSEGTACDVLLVVTDQDIVVSRHSGQVGDSAGAISVVQAADLCSGRTLESNVQFTWINNETKYVIRNLRQSTLSRLGHSK